jgi:hypothetical protein
VAKERKRDKEKRRSIRITETKEDVPGHLLAVDDRHFEGWRGSASHRIGG